jgi:hypothetical protein
MKTTETYFAMSRKARKAEIISKRVAKCTLDENINRAAAELPYGWIIEIKIEAGAAWICLYDYEGSLVDISGDDRTLNEQVSEAISYAREHATP